MFELCTFVLVDDLMDFGSLWLNSMYELLKSREHWQWDLGNAYNLQGYKLQQFSKLCYNGPWCSDSIKSFDNLSLSIE